jgi:hypothetical protein
MPATNYQIAIEQIRDVLALPPHASPAAIVAKVRETKAIVDLAGEALQLRHDPDCLEGPARTREQMASDHAELQRIAPTAPDKFALMFRGTRDHRIS